MSLVTDLRPKVMRAVQWVHREGLKVCCVVSFVYRELRVLDLIEADTSTRRGAHSVFLIC